MQRKSWVFIMACILGGFCFIMNTHAQGDSDTDANVLKEVALMQEETNQTVPTTGANSEKETDQTKDQKSEATVEGSVEVTVEQAVALLHKKLDLLTEGVHVMLKQYGQRLERIELIQKSLLQALLPINEEILRDRELREQDEEERKKAEEHRKKPMSRDVEMMFI